MDPSLESAIEWYPPAETWMMFFPFNTPLMFTKTAIELEMSVPSPS